MRFWAAIARGLSSEDAAATAGVSGTAGVRRFREGGVAPPLTMTRCRAAACPLSSEKGSRCYAPAAVACVGSRAGPSTASALEPGCRHPGGGVECESHTELTSAATAWGQLPRAPPLHDVAPSWRGRTGEEQTMRGASSGRSAQHFSVILGVLIIAAAVAAAVTSATTPAEEVTPDEIAQAAAAGRAAGESPATAGTQILRTTESGKVLEVIEDAPSLAEAPAATDPAAERLGFSAGAISPTWYQSVGGMDLAGDAAADAVATGPRTVYVAGYVTAVSRDLTLVKYVDGVEAWTRIYDGPARGSDEALAVAARGTAIYTAGKRQTKAGDFDLLLIRWDRSGKRVWTRTYDSGSRKFDGASDVAVDRDGNVTVIGTSVSSAGGSDWVMISYRANGTRRWVRRYDGPAHLTDEANRMLVDSSGSVYVVGYSASASNGDDALVAKYSKAGERRWVRRYNGTGNGLDEAYSLRARPGGGVYVAGITYRPTTGYDGLLLAYSGAGRRLLAVADSGGLSSNISEAQAFLDLEVLPGGDILCGGYDERYTDGYAMDRYRAVYKPTGAVFTQSWDYSAGNRSEWITDLAKDGQGGVYITGTYATSSTASQIQTQRFCVGGTTWSSRWPAAPTLKDEPAAIAVSGVNAYVVGKHYFTASDYDQAVLAYIY